MNENETAAPVTVVDEITKLCNDASAKKNEIRAKLTEAERLGRQVRDTLDEAFKLAANCSTKETAGQISAKFNDSLQAAAKIEILKREAAAVNRAFPGLVVQLARALATLKVGQSYVQQSNDEVKEADKAFAAAMRDVSEIDLLQTKIAQGALELESQINRLRNCYPLARGGGIPPDVEKRIQTLEAKVGVLIKVPGAGSSFIKQLADNYKNVQQNNDELDATAKTYLKSVCAIVPMDSEVEQIDAVETEAALAAHAASDLPQKAKQCEARADCLLQMNPIKTLLQTGDTEKAEPLINKLKAQGCDTKEIEDEYWRVQAKVWPLLTRARDAVNNLDAIAKAANCTNKRDAADVQAKYNKAIRTAGQVGAAARAARQTNQGDLQSLLSDINNGKGAYQRANELADRLAEACGKVSSAVDATRADVQSGEALKANFSGVAVGLRAEIDKLRTDYPPDRITPSLNDEISALYSLLDSALVDSNNISFAGIVSAAEAQASRCDGLRSSAQAQLQKYQNAAVCNETTADELVEQMDGVVTGMTVELGAAADADKKATNCLASLNSRSPGADKGKDPASADDVPDWIKNTIKGNEVLGYPVSNKSDKLPSDDVPDFVGNTGRGTKPATDDVPDFVGNTGKGTKPPSDVVPDFVGNTGRGTKPATDDVPDFVGNTGRGSKPTDNAPDFVGNTGKPGAKSPEKNEAPQAKGSLPASMTVCHKRACIWPTTLKLIKQTGDSGEYSGASFQGYPVTATVHLYADGRLVIEIQCRTNGYSGSYSGQRKGNVVEGEYTPSAGFGPRDYFKASW